MFGKTNYTIINKDNKSIVFKGKRVEIVYKINFSELVGQNVICLLSMNDKKWAWHRRLGHANWRLIKPCTTAKRKVPTVVMPSLII